MAHLGERREGSRPRIGHGELDATEGRKDIGIKVQEIGMGKGKVRLCAIREASLFHECKRVKLTRFRVVRMGMKRMEISLTENPV
jgi:hypothetical protein